MNPNPKMTKTVKWAGAAVTAALVVAWLASAWWNLTWTGNGGWLVALRDGRATVGKNGLTGAIRTTFIRNNDAQISNLAREQKEIPEHAPDDEDIKLFRSWRRFAEATHAELVPGWRIHHFGFRLNWRFDVDQEPWGPPPGSPRTFVSVPLWALAAAATLPTAAACLLETRARRRARLNHCPACNYDRRGLPAASPCPECGAVPEPERCCA